VEGINSHEVQTIRIPFAHRFLTTMPPIPLEPHSCHYCQRFLINENQVVNQERGEERNFYYFDFFLPDIITGDADGCSFCTWLLDAEWIHRSATVNEVLARRGTIKEGYETVLDAVAEASIRQDSWLPPLMPTNTLRKYCLEDEIDGIARLRLGCFFHGCLDIKFFVLWDLEEAHVVYRSRSGFSVFTPPGMSSASFQKIGWPGCR